MKHIALTVLAAAAVVSMARGAFAQTPDPHGMKVFTDQKCSLCHSIAAGTVRYAAGSRVPCFS